MLLQRINMMTNYDALDNANKEAEVARKNYSELVKKKNELALKNQKTEGN